MMLDKRKNNMAPTEQGGMPTIFYSDIIDWTFKTLRNDYPRMTFLYITVNKSESNMESLLKSSASRYDLDIINMRLIFSDYYLTHCQPVNGFANTIPGEGHLNEIGHAMVANCLADYFMKKVFR
jgi:hypothetical protein